MKMYVRWKVLISLGFAFWSISCLLDHIWIANLKSTEGFDPTDESPVFEQTSPREEQPVQHVAKADYGHNMLFWSFVTFVGTMVLCFSLKFVANAKSVLLKFRKRGQLDGKPSPSKIPVLTSSKSSLVKVNVLTSDVYKSREQRDKMNMSVPNLLTYPCAESEGKKSNKENLNLSTSQIRGEVQELSSLHQNRLISRKINGLTKEKLELLKQLETVQKENKDYKSQIEEMLEERTLLMKRLNWATREIKANTRAKKKDVVKLEEALLNADKFKNDLEQMSKDNAVLEGKIRTLEEDYGKLSARLKPYEQKDGNSEEEAMEVPAQKSEQREEVKNDESHSKSEMKTVQLKLDVLQKSIDNFKRRQSELSDSDRPTCGSPKNTKKNNANVNQSGENSTGSKEKLNQNCRSVKNPCTNSSNEQEVNVPSESCLSNISEANDTSWMDLSSGDDDSSNFSQNTEERMETLADIEALLPKEFHSGGPPEEVDTCDESGDYWQNKLGGCVSGSPVFQLFVKNVLGQNVNRCVEEGNDVD